MESLLDMKLTCLCQVQCTLYSYTSSYIVHYTAIDSVFLSDFSAERRCPNELFGQGIGI